MRRKPRQSEAVLEQSIVSLLSDCAGGLTTPAIVDELDRARTQIDAALRRLEEAKVVKRTVERSPRGRPANLWVLDP